VPAAINGILATRSETDRYRFTVKKGEPLRVRVWARALGMPLDPQVRIRPVGVDGAAGKPELIADDADLVSREIVAATGDFPDIFDPSVIWTPKQDGDYLLEIADSRGYGGETAVYRIEIEPPSPVVHAALSSTAFYKIERPRVTSLAVPQMRNADRRSAPTGWTSWNETTCSPRRPISITTRPSMAATPFPTPTGIPTATPRGVRRAGSTAI
jgi:hypothetical protein